jgi:hypothetical protein
MMPALFLRSMRGKRRINAKNVRERVVYIILRRQMRRGDIGQLSSTYREGDIQHEGGDCHSSLTRNYISVDTWLGLIERCVPVSVLVSTVRRTTRRST